MTIQYRTVKKFTDDDKPHPATFFLNVLGFLLLLCGPAIIAVIYGIAF